MLLVAVGVAAEKEEWMDDQSMDTVRALNGWMDAELTD